ncbi:MAG: hypothetical protein ABFE07_28985 [Armatimonadia bacterium]
MSNKKLPNPGSEEAVTQNCTCPRIDNHYGRGSDFGPDTFVMSGDCPLHGQAVRDASLNAAKKEMGSWRECKGNQKTPEKPGLRKRMPAKERVIRAALKAYAYPELAIDLDGMSLEIIRVYAVDNVCEDTLWSFIAMELNEVIGERDSFNQACDAAYEALSKAEHDIIKARSAIELLQYDTEAERKGKS